MISNKFKLTSLAAAVAATAAMPALSQLDVDAANHASVKYASEAKVLGTIPASGLVVAIGCGAAHREGPARKRAGWVVDENLRVRDCQ